MTAIRTWRVEDRPPSRMSVARELVAVWPVHVQRSVRLMILS